MTSEQPAGTLATLRPCAAAHLARYLDPDHPGGARAFHAYDGDDRPDTLTATDLLAPVLLSVRMTYADVVPMYSTTGPHRQLRQAIEDVLTDHDSRSADFLSLDLTDPHGPWARVRAAFEASYPVRNLKTVAVSKILHRKRPHLVPIYDRQLHRFYFHTLPVKWRAHERLWPVLQQDLNRHQPWLAHLRDTHQPRTGPQLTLLRTADIIICEHQIAPTAECAPG